MQLVKSALLATAIALAVPVAGCIVSPVPGIAVYGGGHGAAGSTTSTSGAAPIIHSFTASPSSIQDANSVLVFQVVASSQSGAPLQYNWSATKGILSTNSGQTVSWHPTKADGTLDVGIATISVSVFDGTNTTTGSLNIDVNANGTSTVATPAATASAVVSPAPTVAPTVAPTATPVPASASPVASVSPSTAPVVTASATAAASATPAAVVTTKPATAAAAATGAAKS